MQKFQKTSPPKVLNSKLFGGADFSQTQTSPYCASRISEDQFSYKPQLFDYIDRISEQQQKQAETNIVELSKNLKENVLNPKYVDQIVAHSPNYKRPAKTVQNWKGVRSAPRVTSKITSRNRSQDSSKMAQQHQQQHSQATPDEESRFENQTTSKKRKYEGPEEEPYIPGVSKFEAPNELQNILADQQKQLKSHTTKQWLRNKVRFDKFGEAPPGHVKEQESETPLVQPQYLMSEQERKQDELIAMIFAKFDSDGSGALDLNELVDLFKQNKVKLDKPTVKLMFQGDEFTLQKFKAIINSEIGLQRFKDVLKPQRERILGQLEHEAAIAAQVEKEQELKAKKIRTQQKKEAKEKGYTGDSSSDFEVSKPEKKAEKFFMPSTFEGMMEAFGVNLQRKTLYEQFQHTHEQIENMTKRKDSTQSEISKVAQETGTFMHKIMAISSADSNNLKNSHNTLFLSLMERQQHLKEQESKKLERSEALLAFQAQQRSREENSTSEAEPMQQQQKQYRNLNQASTFDDKNKTELSQLENKTFEGAKRKSVSQVHTEENSQQPNDANLHTFQQLSKQQSDKTAGMKTSKQSFGLSGQSTQLEGVAQVTPQQIAENKVARFISQTRQNAKLEAKVSMEQIRLSFDGVAKRSSIPVISQFENQNDDGLHKLKRVDLNSRTRSYRNSNFQAVQGQMNGSEFDYMPTRTKSFGRTPINKRNTVQTFQTPKTPPNCKMFRMGSSDFNEYSNYNSGVPQRTKFNKSDYSQQSPGFNIIQQLKPRRQIQNLLSSAPRIGKSQILHYGARSCKNKMPKNYELSMGKKKKDALEEKNKILLKMCEIQHTNEETDYMLSEPYSEMLPSKIHQEQNLSANDERVPNQSPGKDIYIFCGNNQPNQHTNQKDKDFKAGFNTYLRLGENAIKAQKRQFLPDQGKFGLKYDFYFNDKRHRQNLTSKYEVMRQYEKYDTSANTSKTATVVNVQSMRLGDGAPPAEKQLVNSEAFVKRQNQASSDLSKEVHVHETEVRSKAFLIQESREGATSQQQQQTRHDITAKKMNQPLTSTLRDPIHASSSSDPMQLLAAGYVGLSQERFGTEERPEEGAISSRLVETMNGMNQ